MVSDALTRICRYFQHFAWVVLGGMIVIITFDATLDLQDRFWTGSYYQISSPLSTDRTLYSAGDPIRVTVFISRYIPSKCRIEVDRFIVNASTDEIAWAQIVPGIETNGIKVKITRTWIIPPLPSGRYKLRVHVHNRCPTFTITSSSVSNEFEISETKGQKHSAFHHWPNVKTNFAEN